MRRTPWLIVVAGLVSPVAFPQSALDFSNAGGVVRILNSDLAVLESRENRDDLRCRVEERKPELGFDMRFHTGYRVTIPLKDLSGSGDRLRLLMRVIPVQDGAKPLYLADRFTVPPIEEDAKGEASLPGRFAVGPGRYRVDWLMRNTAQRVCSAHWEIEARLDDDDRDLPLTLPPHTVAQQKTDPFSPQPPIERVSPAEGLHVKLLVNFSPPDPKEATLKPWDLEAIVSILRGVAREPQFRSFSIVAFNMQEERIIYRSDHVQEIDFPALGEAVAGVKLGTVDYRQLLDPQSETRFLTGLLTEQFSAQAPAPDAIVIVGPKVMLDKGIPRDALQQAGYTGCPVFYLNYNADPRRNPWRDAIATALKVYKGFVYTIRGPRDLGTAMTDMKFQLTAH